VRNTGLRSRSLVVACAVGLALVGASLTASVGADEAPVGVTGPAGRVLAPIDPTVAPMPDPEALSALLTGPLASAALGNQVSGVVFDAATGVLLFDQGGDVPRTPGSVVKILTAVSVLQAVGPSTRLATTAHYDPATATLVLVGGGDPTLATRSGEGSSLAELADAVVAAGQGPRPGSSVRLVYDASLFEGPSLAVGWASSYPANGVTAPVSALVVDGARIPGSDARQENPALAAARVFADLLAERGVTVDAPQPGQVGTAPQIGATESVPLAQIVQSMLTDSDNDYAEILAHLAGATRFGVGTFDTGTEAALATLTTMGISTAGITLYDGSGLSVDNRVPTRTFAQVLTSLTRPSMSATDGRAMADGGWGWPVLGGLPIAGVTGTLADRFYTESSYAGAGVVHAKTGTLTGVSSLAGTAVDRDGRLLVFAFTTNSAAEVASARASLDAAATIVARCGCQPSS
jgi:D-alanyl-D-alanine carboxypeptidase/D-alanyl-D-alanine-endopeptidase (penicillin-binding protein 4)